MASIRRMEAIYAPNLSSWASTRAPLLLAALAACAGPQRAAPDWSPPPLPGARHGHRVEPLAGGFLAFGGFARDDAGEDRGTHLCCWLPRGGTAWQRRADLRHGQAFGSSAVIDGIVYAVGGDVERYDAAADRWVEVVPPGALPESHFAAAAVGRELFVLGGYPVERSALFAVDAATGAVRREPPPPSFAPGDHFHFLAALGGELHVVGGLDASTFVPRREHWVRRAGSWVALPEPPPGLWAKFGGQAVVGGCWYLFGDFGGCCFDPATGRWTPRAPWPGEFVLPGVIADGGTIHVLGGMRVEGDRGVLLAYDTDTDAWRDLGR
jgi:hypothetical protein